jgi:hypothetical protein
MSGLLDEKGRNGCLMSESMRAMTESSADDIRNAITEPCNHWDHYRNNVTSGYVNQFKWPRVKGIQDAGQLSPVKRLDYVP